MNTEHITDALLDEVFLFRGDPDGSKARKLLDHCQTCSTCSELLATHRQSRREMEALKGLREKRDHADCPADEMWIKMAFGLVNESESRRLQEHASECSDCTKRLRTACSYLVDEPEQVAGLCSATEDWQRAMGEQMARYPRATETGKVQRVAWFWIPVAAAVTLLLVFLALLSRRQPADADHLLGEAYAQHRTMELRFSGAQYGPIQIERGQGEKSLVNQSAALLEAATLIAKNLDREPNNPLWLDRKGRADLLSGHYQAAINSFQNALDADPESAQLLIDAASAYFQRGQLSDQPEDYGEAIELLDKALAKKPDDPVALFNRALVREKMYLYRQAVEDWNRFLQIDPKSKWAGEANQHLNLLRQKLNEQQKGARPSVLDPSLLLTNRPTGETAIQDTLRGRSEDYLDLAIRLWLPEAFAAKSDTMTGKPPAAASSVWRALNVLAKSLDTDHGDHWLSDLLGSPGQARAQGIRSLAEAANANAKGDFELARVKAREAVRTFRNVHNAAGELRAQLEMVYALHRAELGKPCLNAAKLLADRVAGRKYPWIQIQLELEESSCSEQLGKFGEAARHSEAATARAQRAGYGTLYLRALGIAAGLQTNARVQYSQDLLGLTQYWNGTYPPMRAYQFYSDLGFPAEAAGQWNLALDLEKEAVSTIALTEQSLGEALAHQRLGKTALFTGDHDLATTEFGRANRLYAGLPPTQATHTYQASAEIDLAIMESARGDVEQSAAHLAKARGLLPRIVHYFIALSFFKAVSAVERLKGNIPESEKARRAAAVVAEWGLASLGSGREREAWARETRQVYTDLAESYWRNHDAEGALSIWEWYRGASVRTNQTFRPFPSSHAAAPQSNDIDFDSLASTPRLPTGKHLLQVFRTLTHTTVFSYMQLPKGLIVWAFDDRGLTPKWIPVSSQEMRNRIRRFRDECASPTSDIGVLRKDARQLYDLLIGPVSDHLSTQRTLVIEPDESIADLPVSALVDQSGAYLGQKYALVFSPGLLYQIHLRRSTTLSNKEHALVVGSPAIRHERTIPLEALDDAILEAEYTASGFEEATLLTGKRASLSALRKELPRTVVFHFAGHTQVSAGKTELLLADWPPASSDRTILDDFTLATMDLHRLQLAVLSACSTANEDDSRAGIAEGLVKAFLRSGVPHVVATRWSIDSKATTQFMRLFYDHLWEGHSVPSSLQLATAEIANRSGEIHPYYWAAFVSFGR